MRTSGRWARLRSASKSVPGGCTSSSASVSAMGISLRARARWASPAAWPPGRLTGWSVMLTPIPTPPWSRCARSSGPPARSSPSTTPCGGWATALKKTLRASERDRADIAEKRRLWQQGQKQLPAGRLVFIDESSAKTNMTRLRGRVRGGQRLHDHAPGSHWHTVTMLGSIRLDGVTSCMVIEGATDSDVFREYVRQVLGPTLRPGDIVICDNLAAHRDAEAQKFIEARGAQLVFLPAYSPDLNPIEMMWSKVKTHLRQVKARTDEDLLTAIADALHRVSRADAHGFFRHAGYVCTIY